MFGGNGVGEVLVLILYPYFDPRLVWLKPILYYYSSVDQIVMSYAVLSLPNKKTCLFAFNFIVFSL